MSKQKKSHVFIYKLHSSKLLEADWNLILPLEEGMEDMVELNDSQLLRFIDQMNGANTEEEVVKLKSYIKALKVRNSHSTEIKKAYKRLYEIQFRPDYVCIIMDKLKHYDRCNQGFSINGIQYRRFVGTNNGVKKSTIIYINADKWEVLHEIMECGRDLSKALVPAKLEAYRALICSGSIPVSMPRGIIVVPDCKVKFKDDGIFIDDSKSDEPEVTYVKDREVELDVSDGFGFMCPEISMRWSGELNGRPTGYLSAVNSRGLPWVKGMLFTFDFKKFAEEVAGTYTVKDVWGTMRDVREAEVILTESMLKLWDSYASWEHYWSNVEKYGYGFAVSKTAPYELEEERTTNYQFLQSYELSDRDIDELIAPTVDNIKDVAGMDYRKAILYLGGNNIKPESVLYKDANIAQALMVDPNLINDRYIRSSIHDSLKVRIKRAKTGVLDVKGNFAIIGGDPYALAQSMFGLPVTGLLKKGYIYHKFWLDREVDEVCLFRAPMTNHNNIRKQAVANRFNCDNYEEMSKWYQYITTCVLFNSWDSTAEALNGADFDGDLCYTTNNRVLLNHHRKLPVVFCVQRRAEKKAPTEQDIITANKLSFGDEIGAITNVITSQICLKDSFNKDSEEYKALSYRILCAQQQQQNAIDKAKGIIAKPMPKYWKSKYGLKENEDDTEEERERKRFLKRIAADRKPYFFIYNYNHLYSEYNKFLKKACNAYACEYGGDLVEDFELYKMDRENWGAKRKSFFEFFDKFLPIDMSPCTMNRICWAIERQTKGFNIDNNSDYDWHKLKAPYPEYSSYAYRLAKPQLLKEYDSYRVKMQELNYKLDNEYVHGADRRDILQSATDKFLMKLDMCCPDEELRCDILLEIAYKNNKSKRFVWEMCGSQIVKNLLARHGHRVTYPVVADIRPEFTYHGIGYSMVTEIIDEEADIE